MNFLAHFLLAEGSDETLAGNFLGDFVKGVVREGDYPPKILQGIRTHRAVDGFSDRHPITGVSRRRFSVKFSRISGIIVDVSFDHFLALNWQRFCCDEIGHFISKSYDAVEAHAHLMPEQFAGIVPRLRDQDWLNETRTVDGLRRIFRRMSRRSPILNHLESAIVEIEANHEALERDFLKFFPDVIEFVRERRSQHR